MDLAVRCATVAVICFVAATDAEASADDWQVLFDGTNLDAFDYDKKKKGWEITPQGELYRARKGGFIYTKSRFCDFVLDLEFKVAKKTNSGVFIRMHSRKDWLHTSMEIQVLDSSGKDKPDKHDAGAIYDIQAPSTNAMKPPGEWNRYVITADENMVTVVLNGKKVNEIDLDRWTEGRKNPDGSKNKFKYAQKDLIREGFIAFQDHGNPVWYRNIRIKPLNGRMPQYKGTEKFQSIVAKERARQAEAMKQRAKTGRR
jgi:hypothetical protein